MAPKRSKKAGRKAEQHCDPREAGHDNDENKADNLQAPKIKEEPEDPAITDEIEFADVKDFHVEFPDGAAAAASETGEERATVKAEPASPSQSERSSSPVDKQRRRSKRLALLDGSDAYDSRSKGAESAAAGSTRKRARVSDRVQLKIEADDEDVRELDEWSEEAATSEEEDYVADDGAASSSSSDDSYSSGDDGARSKNAFAGRYRLLYRSKSKPDYAQLIKLHCSRCDASYPRVSRQGSKTKNPSHCPGCDGPLSNRCQLCRRSLRSYDAALGHVKLVCQPRARFACNECDEFETSSEHNVRNHLAAKHTRVEPEDYARCGRCDKAFRLEQRARQHERMCGLGKVHECARCDYRTKWPAEYRRHARRHEERDARGEEEPPKKKTISRAKKPAAAESEEDAPLDEGINLESRSLNKSEKLLALPYMELHCAKCSSSDPATTRVNPRRRQKRISCPRCDSLYSGFRCLGCPRSYPRISNLQRHVKTEHLLSDEQRLQHRCDGCEQRFTFRDRLREHRKTCAKQ